MNTRHLHYALAIEQYGQLSIAASKVGVSQPILSRYLIKEEERIGRPIFERIGRTYVPTAAGRIYLESARKILELQSQTNYTIRQLAGLPTEHVRVALTPHHGARVIAQVYPQMIQRYGNLMLDLVEGYSESLLHSLRTGKASMLLNFYQPGLLPGTKAAIYMRCELRLMVPAYHPIAAHGSTDIGNPPRISPEDFMRLQDIPFACFGTQTFSGHIIQQVLKATSFSPITTFTSNNALTIRALLETGLYAGFNLAMYDRALPDMVYFLPPYEVPYYMAAGIYMQEHQETEAERYLAYLHYRLMLHNACGTEEINPMMERLLEEFD